MRTTTIKDFKKEKIIGKGSFGSVFLVRRIADNKIYALKSVILDKLNKKEQENSVNEVRILASINHPNVIGYKEAFWEDKTSSLNIVMEYADDGDLQSKIIKMKNEGGFFKESIIWEYSIQMIEGLKALHDKKIMHRDLKSANIFLFKENHLCKLGDMNVSKVIKEKVLLTQTGTPYYASPEVWRDEPYSYKSDLWSIGCVIYELCELHPPFKGKDLDELFEDVCKGAPKRINKIYSNDLWNMIMMLLQVDVEKRVDCNMYLKSNLILKKIQEMKNNPNKYNFQGINLAMDNDAIQQDLLHTIKFSNLNEIKYQLPSTKNYNCTNISNDFKNKGIIYTKSPIVKKSPSINKKSSRKENRNKKVNNDIKGKEDNNTLLLKLKEIQAKKENMKIKLIKQIKLKNSKEKNKNININIDTSNKININKNNLKYKSKKDILNINKEIKREIKTEQNSDRKIYSNKLLYNKSEIFDKHNKIIINQIKRLNTVNSKGSIFKPNKLPHTGGIIKNRDKIPKIKNKNIPNNICSNNNLLSEFLRKNYDNFAGTPSRQIIKDKNNIPINYYNKLLKNKDSIPVSTSSSKAKNSYTHINNCQSFDGHKEFYKQIKCNRKRSLNNHPISNIINIPTGKIKNTKEFVLRKLSPNLIKRKNTYTKGQSQYIKEKKLNRIKTIVIKRNKSINFDYKNNFIKKYNLKSINSINNNNNFNNNYSRKYNSIQNLHNNKSEILIKDYSFNSLNSKSKIINSSYEKKMIGKNKIPNNNIKLNDNNYMNINIKINKNLIKNQIHHQRYPTITSVQQSILNNFNNYKMISSNIRIKRINNNNRTLSNQLNLHKNILNKNSIKYKKINLTNKQLNNNNYHKKHNETEINSLLNYLEKSINNSDLTDDNLDKNTINKTTINKNALPNVEFNNFLIRQRPLITNNENESNNLKKHSINNINKLNNYLSPKTANSQIFNNYYSFNNVETTNIPVKVINIFKK